MIKKGLIIISIKDFDIFLNINLLFIYIIVYYIMIYLEYYTILHIKILDSDYCNSNYMPPISFL